jgi:hypothetical protein
MLGVGSVLGGPEGKGLLGYLVENQRILLKIILQKRDMIVWTSLIRFMAAHVSTVSSLQLAQEAGSILSN